MSGTKQWKFPFCYLPDAKRWSQILPQPFTINSFIETLNSWFTVEKMELKDGTIHSVPFWKLFSNKDELDADGNVKQTKKRKKRKTNNYRKGKAKR